MVEHEINKLDNFICGWYLDDTSVCDELIEFHKLNPQKHKGYVGNAITKTQTEINANVKDSTDSSLFAAPQPLIHKYVIDNLQLAADAYVTKYPCANSYAPWSVVEQPNIQHYAPGGGFKVWHTERGTHAQPQGARHLVFMTYLNDVEDGGETEFLHQKIKVKPEKGLTLIWGSDWTFTHRGIPSPSQEKYIVTGWYSFVDAP